MPTSAGPRGKENTGRVALGAGLEASGIGGSKGAPGNQRTWRAVGYARISNAVESAEGSPSVALQREEVERFVAGEPSMSLVAQFEDDGWSGSSFRRPGFQAMERLLEAGGADCIVVRDLSRLGRNYLEMGRYLEQVLPARGVRLIALADGYDSLYPGPEAQTLLVPLKNLMNDYYCAIASEKTRRSLHARRKAGANVSPFAPYGYRKDEGMAHFVPDAETAPVVREVFALRLHGMGASGIARRLNEQGVATPQEAKRRQGSGHHSPDSGPRPVWSARMVNRILANEAYTGTLAQGRRTTPSFRSRLTRMVPNEQVIRTAHAHEALVAWEDFEHVARLRRNAALGVGRPLAMGRGGDE